MMRGRFGQTAAPGVHLRRPVQKPGFSLVELLLATGVILILLSIMLPAMKRSVRQARQTVCLSNLRVLDQLLQMYHTENEGWLPVPPSPEDLPPGQVEAAWFDLLVPRYAADLSVMVCAEDPYGCLLTVANPAVPRSDHDRAASYGMNDFILASPRKMLANVERRQAKRPLDTLLLADMGPDLTRRKSSGHLPGAPGGGSGHGTISWTDGFNYTSVDQRYSWVTQRHALGINVLTMGGAVRLIPTRSIITRVIDDYYEPCAAGGCPLCRELRLPHYSFYDSQTFWWTGSFTTP